MQKFNEFVSSIFESPKTFLGSLSVLATIVATIIGQISQNFNRSIITGVAVFLIFLWLWCFYVIFKKTKIRAGISTKTVDAFSQRSRKLGGTGIIATPIISFVIIGLMASNLSDGKSFASVALYGTETPTPTPTRTPTPTFTPTSTSTPAPTPTIDLLKIKPMTLQNVINDDGTSGIGLSAEPVDTGSVILEYPANLAIGDSATLKLRIIPDSSLGDSPIMIESQPPQSTIILLNDQIDIYPIMVAELRGLAIIASPPEKIPFPVVTSRPIEWTWLIEAKTIGIHKMVLHISTPVSLNENSEDTIYMHPLVESIDFEVNALFD